MTVPYESATSGAGARDEIVKMLRRLGCDTIGFMDNYSDNSVLLQFSHRGRQMKLIASAQGWAAMYLREYPWTQRHKRNRPQYEAAALQQGLVAVNSILRDWVKGQVTAIECGVMSFDAAFMPHMITNDGRTFVERASEINLLPAPNGA